MTAYHPYCVLADMVKHRDDSFLYTVDVENQRPQALYLRCYGNGAETIVFENDIRTTAEMYFDGLPKYMADQHGYKVRDLVYSGGSGSCRRGAPTSDASAFQWKCMCKRKHWVPLGRAHWQHPLDPSMA